MPDNCTAVALPLMDPKLLNHLKIQQLLHYTTNLLRARFRLLWAQVHAGKEWDGESQENTADFLSGCSPLLLRSLNVAGLSHRANIQKWDLTILADVLLYHKQLKWRVKNEDEECLKALKVFRNKFAHNPEDGFEDEEFEKLWSGAVPSVRHFGGQDDEIDRIKGLGCQENANGDNERSNVTDGGGGGANAGLAADLGHQAEEMMGAERFEEAIEAYTTALGLEGLGARDRANLFSGRSKAYLALAKQLRTNPEGGDGEEFALNLNQPEKSAHSDAKAAIALRPEWFQGYYDAGRAYAALDKLQNALTSFDMALALAPDRRDILRLRYECRQQIGMEDRQHQVGPTPERPESEEQVAQMIRDRFGGQVNITSFKRTRAEGVPGQEETNLGHDAREDGNLVSAVEHYKNGALEENIEALYCLAIMCIKGKGLERDTELAVDLLKQVASSSADRHPAHEESVSASMHALGLCCEEGVGIQQDCAAAAEWYERASELGYGWSSANLGSLYHRGLGVPKDQDKARGFWKLAEEQGCPTVALYVAESYLSPNLAQYDPDLARNYFQRALDSGCQVSAEAMAKFLAGARRCEEYIALCVGLWEAGNGHQAGGMSLKERQARMVSALPLPGGRASAPACQVQAFDPETLEAAAASSLTAARVLKAVRHFERAVELKAGALLGGDDSSITAFVKEMANTIRNEPLAFGIEISAEDIRQTGTLVRAILERSSGGFLEPSDLDRDARLCNLHLNYQNENVDEKLTFARACKEKYQEELSFHRFVAMLSGVGSGKTTEANLALALKQIKASSAQFQDDPDLLFDLARVTRLQALSRQPFKASAAISAIKEYERFLAAAPNDHRFVPEAYYAIGGLHMWGEEVLQKAAHEKKYGSLRGDTPRVEIKYSSNGAKFYEKGVEAEGRLLEQYLTYYSAGGCDAKVALEIVLKINGGPAPTPPAPVGPDQAALDRAARESLLTKLKAVHRVRAIVAHRKKMAEIRMVVTNSPFRSRITLPGGEAGEGHVVALHSSGRTIITFAEMSPNRQHRYVTRYLTVRSIEEPISTTPGAVYLMLEDQGGNFDVCRCVVYGLDDTDRRLAYGATFRILDPYLRLAADGNHAIRVETPQEIEFLTGGMENVCRVCRSADAVRKCSKCKTSHYCSPECQEVDWKNLKHKQICTPRG